MEKVVINVIGIGYDICLGDIDEETKLLLGSHNLHHLHQLLFNEDFYKKYSIINNGKLVRTWEDFNSEGIYRGADIFENGQIEIWVNRKKVKKYKFLELQEDSRLFPLFESSEENISSNSICQIIIGVQEKGFLRKFVFLAEKFSMEGIKLYFVNIPLQNKIMKLLYKICYFDIELRSLRSDTIITSTVMNFMS